ncbi:hypothetical protein OUZ56_025484 [Daphnia magna]|uniref:Uncharacterized protein n=1 Tax=Daphnia magna TaxID=35525 RepID=A0ABQ9ZJZ4_9CRUS|nr:hypothetical protein OUZ56_025484 [Daphnia magna]
MVLPARIPPGSVWFDAAFGKAYFVKGQDTFRSWPSVDFHTWSVLILRRYAIRLFEVGGEDWITTVSWKICSAFKTISNELLEGILRFPLKTRHRCSGVTGHRT